MAPPPARTKSLGLWPQGSPCLKHTPSGSPSTWLLTCTRGKGRRLWFSDTLMGGMTQALRTRPSVGARRQGYRVRGCLSLGTPAEGHKLCNEGERPSPAQQRPGLPRHSPDVPSLDARPSPVWPGEATGPGPGWHGELRRTEGGLAPRILGRQGVGEVSCPEKTAGPSWAALPRLPPLCG